MSSRPWNERVYESILMSRPFVSDTSTPAALLSVAIWSFAIELRSSWLVAAEVFVSGVFTDEPFTEPEGVEVPVVVDASVAPLPFADCFAAFSARRFCFDAEGAIFADVRVSFVGLPGEYRGWGRRGERGRGGRAEESMHCSECGAHTQISA